jgi:tripartite-type tricarboxylate transporter receptor subunit TctC
MIHRLVGVLAVALGSAAAPALAQSYANNPIRFIVPYQPGGSSDTVARIIGHKLSELAGQPVIIDNRAGGGANIGTGIVAKATPDGRTLLLGSTGPNAVNASLYDSLPFDPVKSFAPVTLVSSSTSFLIVNLALPVNSVKELIAYAKSRPEELAFGSAGNGSSPHIAGELFNSMTGVRMRHIPYKSSPPGLADLLGGRLQVFFPSGANALALIRAGKVRALAVTSRARSPLLPDLPTVAEAGVPGFEVEFWFGVLAPAGTPTAVVTKLNADINRILKMPDVQDKMNATGETPRGSTPHEFAALIKKDIVRWGEVVRKSGAKAD